MASTSAPMARERISSVASTRMIELCMMLNPASPTPETISAVSDSGKEVDKDSPIRPTQPNTEPPAKIASLLYRSRPQLTSNSPARRW